MPKNSKIRHWVQKNNTHRYAIFNKFVPYECEDDYHYYNDPVPPFDNFYQDTEVALVQDLSINESVEVNLTPVTSQKIRVIDKRNLYEDWSLFYTLNNTNKKSHAPQVKSNDWTDSCWKKHIDNEEALTSSSQTKSFTRGGTRENKLEKSLNEMLSKPAEMSKGKSLLEKMGWTGGGLGREGTGIEEPIAPHATYAVNTIGLGHPTEGQLEKKYKNVYTIPTEDPECKANFRTNVLLSVLEFVRNDAEIEVIFDHRLWREERKRVHHIIQCIREFDELEEFEEEYYEERDLDIVRDIWEHNMYNLWTESDGEKADRKLYVYKEAREHIYLVTPDDLRDLTEEEYKQAIRIVSMNKNKKTKFFKKPTANEVNFGNELQLDKEEMERTKDNTDEVTEPNTILGRIVEYFKEFSESSEYTEFRYLGPFNDEEVADWRLFYDICLKRDEGESSEKTELLKAFKNPLYIFEVVEDCNGSTVIYKFERSVQLAPPDS